MLATIYDGHDFVTTGTHRMDICPIYTPLKLSEVVDAFAMLGYSAEDCLRLGYLIPSIHLPSRGSQPISYYNLYDVLRGGLCAEFVKLGYYRVELLADIVSDCLAISLTVHDRAVFPTVSVRVEMFARLREEIEKQEALECFTFDLSSRPQLSRLASIAFRLWQALTRWFYDFLCATQHALGGCQSFRRSADVEALHQLVGRSVSYAVRSPALRRSHRSRDQARAR